MMSDDDVICFDVKKFPPAALLFNHVKPLKKRFRKKKISLFTVFEVIHSVESVDSVESRSHAMPCQLDLCLG